MRNGEATAAGRTKTPGSSHSLTTPGFPGAGNGIRTRDPNLGKVVLYQLSYSRKRTGRYQERQRIVKASSPPARVIKSPHPPFSKGGHRGIPLDFCCMNC